MPSASVAGLHDACGLGVGCGLGGLKVEAASDAVDVEHLAGEIEAMQMAAFERRGTDGLKGDATAGNKLVFEGSLAGDGVAVLF